MSRALRWESRAAVMVVGLLMWSAAASAQCASRGAAFVGVRSAADDSARVGSLLGDCWADPSLVRSSLSLGSRDTVASLALGLIDPGLSFVRNSSLPVSFNDGALWAGRGTNLTVSAGFTAYRRGWTLVVAPLLMTSQNLPFQVMPSGNVLRSSYASPWHSNIISADLPLRFGNRRLTRIDPGETTLELARGHVAGGLTSSSQWWGPGIWNALLMSNNAAGIPRLYLRSAHPIVTRLGHIEGQWMLGVLTESPFFDYDVRNDLRSLSSAVVTLRAAADSGLTIGAARSVYASARRFGRIPGHFADVFIDWHRQSLHAPSERASDQLTSFFARWAFPEAGMATHVEWVKLRVPKSGRELLVDPHLSQGYTLGLEWARRFDPLTTLRVQAEVTMLEQTPEALNAIIPEFYASYSVPQGYTQQGQVIGAAIGPASSSQNTGITLFHGRSMVGLQLGRIRWEETAYYHSAVGFSNKVHDVSLAAVLNARHDTRRLAVDVAVARMVRMNYLFQTADPYEFKKGFDVTNTGISVLLTPHLSRRSPPG